MLLLKVHSKGITMSERRKGRAASSLTNNVFLRVSLHFLFRAHLSPTYISSIPLSSHRYHAPLHITKGTFMDEYTTCDNDMHDDPKSDFHHISFLNTYWRFGCRLVNRPIQYNLDDVSIMIMSPTKKPFHHTFAKACCNIHTRSLSSQSSYS